MGNFIKKGIVYYFIGNPTIGTKTNPYKVLNVFNDPNDGELMTLNQISENEINYYSTRYFRAFPDVNSPYVNSMKFIYYPTNYPQDKILAMLNSSDYDTRQYVKALLEEEDYNENT